MARVVKYRGITNLIRHGIANDHLVGKINISDVRKLLPGIKRKAPSRVIRNCLVRMAKNNEIENTHGVFYTKSHVTPKAPGRNVRITGSLIETKSDENGKLIAVVEVASLAYG